MSFLDLKWHFGTALRRLGGSMNKERERILYEKMIAGDSDARETLILEHDYLVQKIAKKYEHLAPIEDLIQEGRVALIMRMDHFDANKGRLKVYSIPFIHQRICRFLSRHRSMVRLPEPQTQALLKLIRIRDRIQVELHREATVDDLKRDSEVISDHKNYQKWNKSVISLEDYISILNFSEPVSSLEYTITEDENIKLLDVIADPVAEDRIRAIELQDLGDRLLEVLNERECFILKAIASGWTRKEIGEHLGLNSQDISNRKLQAIKKIKEHVKNDPELTEVLKDMGLL